MDFDVLRKRVQDENAVRARRAAAETNIPSERLRREIREAFAREDARKAAQDRARASEPDTDESEETGTRPARQ